MDYNYSIIDLFELPPSILSVGTTQQATDKNANTVPTNISYISQRREPSQKTFRIFVSSTFSDQQEERNALQKMVFPELRMLCMKHGCRL